MGYSRKYPHPLWTTLNWVPKNSRIFKKDTSSLCRIPNPTDSEYWGIPEFCKILNGFPGIPVKIHKIWRKFMEIQSGSPSIHYRISNVVHGRCVDIFWNSPMYPRKKRDPGTEPCIPPADTTLNTYHLIQHGVYGFRDRFLLEPEMP